MRQGRKQLSHTHDLHSERRLERSPKGHLGAVDDAGGDIFLGFSESFGAELARAMIDDPRVLQGLKGEK
jgi:hypothetical protein